VAPLHDCRLSGAGVLVTRPSHQAEGLCALVAARGGHAIRFPALEIREPSDPAVAERLLRAANDFDMLLFVSANAVERAVPFLPRPLRPALGGVGEGTARALRASGFEPTILPTTSADSEGLLALPALRALLRRRILIVRGEGGRPLLGDELRARGAEVHYAEVYRRVLPEVDVAPLIAAWPHQVHVVVTTSLEVLDNLARLLGAAGRSLLQETPLVVVSERMRAHARTLGVRRVIVAAGPGDEALVQAVCAADRAVEPSAEGSAAEP
jgi:uroporphyrinogen-III synthase